MQTEEWDDSDGLDGWDRFDEDTVSAMSAIDYMERDLEQDSQVELQLNDMVSSFSKANSDDTRRVLFASMLSVLVSRREDVMQR